MENIPLIEAIQRMFICKIIEEQHFNYWGRLHKFNYTPSRDVVKVA